MDDLSLEELYHMKRNIEKKIDNYFGDDQKYYGDRGYQEALVDLEEIEDEIEKRENNNVMENLMNFDQFSLKDKKNK